MAFRGGENFSNLTDRLRQSADVKDDQGIALSAVHSERAHTHTERATNPQPPPVNGTR